ncbi:MAG: tRNA lysidine(34) synthetase TilS [Deltaproteobacteria bacterium]|nr:tRNA lysidine(34) synthetase TilS [Deltaproteobacteria bacterium]
MTAPASDLARRISRTVLEQRLFGPGDTLIVALSGGADSTALLDLLSGLPGFQPRLVAAHLNHSLRGADSEADEAFSRGLAGRYSIPFESRRVDVRAFAAQHRLNLEDAGRRARHAFFEELRRKWGAAAVALGHHADDQAETVLMRLLRGAGSAGLSGMPYRNERGFIRPLLDVTRSEIEEWLTQKGLAWREDQSNRDTAFLRNRIRHELLPLLEGYNPAVRERLTATAGLLAADDDLLETLTRKEYARLAERGAAAVAFEVAALTQMHPAMLRRLIRHAVSELAGDLRHLSLRHVGDVAALLDDGPPNRRITLPGLLLARREYGRLVIQRAGADLGTPEEVVIDAPGRYRLWDGMTLEISPAAPPERLDETSPGTAWLDPAKAPFPWLVRTFLPGDRIVPFGMSGSRKVKEIFIDAKIPLSQRKRIPLVLSGETLIWVCGLRSSDLARIDGSSARIVKAVLSGN